MITRFGVRTFGLTRLAVQLNALLLFEHAGMATAQEHSIDIQWSPIIQVRACRRLPRFSHLGDLSVSMPVALDAMPIGISRRITPGLCPSWRSPQ
jgi:hypothetical protein